MRLLARLRVPRRGCRLLDVAVPGPFYAPGCVSKARKFTDGIKNASLDPLGEWVGAGRSSEVNRNEAGTGDLA